MSLDEKYADWLESLRAAAEEASRPNWDGYGGEAVSSVTVAQAVALLDLLPGSSPGPEISAHLDGELAFESFVNSCRLLTVSVNEWGRVSYAAMFGFPRLRGAEVLGDVLPDAIALALRRLYASG